jgi:demethylmenaquinone methyltransferase / 2-methoxy-6-polyprenyl-1,4-benzoquinol methylase
MVRAADARVVNDAQIWSAAAMPPRSWCANGYHARRMSQALPPHPPLEQYYGEPAKRERFVREIFDDTAEWYDAIIAMLSFGSGNRYRAQALARAGLTPSTRLLDVATGTGVVARAALRVTQNAIGLDPSIGMLVAGRRVQRMRQVQARAESLPFAHARFDLLTVGYALRHFADLRATFEEYRRVLAPGGKVLILEITRPRTRLAHAMLAFYLGRVIPLVTRLRTRSRNAQTLMHYYWDTIDRCVPPEQILAALREAGFRDVARHVELGIFSEYSGIA